MGKDAMVVKMGKVILSEGDYEIVGYNRNIKKGTGQITIRGLGIYGGRKNSYL